MATIPEGFSLILDILRLFQGGAGRQLAATSVEIAEMLNEDKRARWPYEGDFIDYGYFLHDIYRVEELVEMVLASMAELGLVNNESDREASSGFTRWRIADSWKPPEPPREGGIGGGGGGGRAGGDDGDEDGGGGLREALSHPVLFALDWEDFDNLIDGLFEEERQ